MLNKLPYLAKKRLSTLYTGLQSSKNLEFSQESCQFRVGGNLFLQNSCLSDSTRKGKITQRKDREVRLSLEKYLQNHNEIQCSLKFCLRSVTFDCFSFTRYFRNHIFKLKKKLYLSLTLFFSSDNAEEDQKCPRTPTQCKTEIVP